MNVLRVHCLKFKVFPSVFTCVNVYLFEVYVTVAQDLGSVRDGVLEILWEKSVQS